MKQPLFTRKRLSSEAFAERVIAVAAQLGDAVCAIDADDDIMLLALYMVVEAEEAHLCDVWNTAEKHPDSPSADALIANMRNMGRLLRQQVLSLNESLVPGWSTMTDDQQRQALALLAAAKRDMPKA